MRCAVLVVIALLLALMQGAVGLTKHGRKHKGSAMHLSNRFRSKNNRKNAQERAQQTPPPRKSDTKQVHKKRSKVRLVSKSQVKKIFRTGDVVQLHGLSNHALNGHNGTIIRQVSNGDGYEVELDREVSIKHKKQKILTFLSANLRAPGADPKAVEEVTQARLRAAKQKKTEAEQKAFGHMTKQERKEFKRRKREEEKLHKRHEAQKTLLASTRQKVPVWIKPKI